MFKITKQANILLDTMVGEPVTFTKEDQHTFGQMMMIFLRGDNLGTSSYVATRLCLVLIKF